MQQIIDFILEIDKLKGVTRRTRPLGLDRQENSAEHSWQIALLASSLAPYAVGPVNVDHVIAMLLVHDIGEIDTGDTIAYAVGGWEERKEAELAAVTRIFGLLPEPLRDRYLALWKEFEAGATADSRFANAADRAMPVLLNLANNGQSWRENGISHERVVARVRAQIENGCPALWKYLERELAGAQARGWFGTISEEASSPDVTRRDFLQSAAAGVLGASVLPRLGAHPLAAHSRTDAAATAKLGVQLYTVRDQIKADLPGTLRRVAALGFDGVETAFWPAGVTLSQAGTALRDAGLLVSSCHIELPIGDKRQVMLDTAKAFGARRMIWHGWPEDPRYGSLEGTKALAAIYNQCNRFAKDNGLQFGLHNHWWEYRNKVGGKYVFEVLLEEIDPDIFLEVDTYWVKVAGHDPAAIISRLGARAQLMHIKDGPALYNDKLAIDNPDPMTAVGKGTQNFPAIVRASNGRAEWLVIEMDKTATDVFDALRESVDYLVSHQFVRERKHVAG